jgi:hypothetical protein
MRNNNAPEAPPETPSGKSGKLMYIGPSIFDPILLSHRGVYSSLPALLQKLPTEKREALEACFVPLDKEAAAALRELEGVKPAGQVSAKYKTAHRLVRSKK